MNNMQETLELVTDFIQSSEDSVQMSRYANKLEEKLRSFEAAQRAISVTGNNHINLIRKKKNTILKTGRTKIFEFFGILVTEVDRIFK